MEGDVIYVLRERLLFKSFKDRKNSRSTKLDELISRLCTYKHYGIEVEDGNVIHFICDSIFLTKEGSIKKVTMAEFLKGGKKEVDTNINCKFSKKHVAQRAYSRLNTNFNGYHLFKNNCEHFTVWCASGLKASSQAQLTNTAYSVVQIPRKASKRVALATVALFSILKF